MKHFLWILVLLIFYDHSFAGGLYATIEDGQVIYKNRPTFFRNVINNSGYNRSYVKELIQKAALKYNVNGKFVYSIAMAESGLNYNAISGKGAIGVMQIMPSTASLLNINPNNLEQNIDGGVKYLKYLLDKFNNKFELAAAAYNSGPKNVEKYNGIPPFPETINYVKTVMSYFDNKSIYNIGTNFKKSASTYKKPLKIVEKDGVFTNMPNVIP